MASSSGRYVLWVQLLMLVADVASNAVAPLLYQYNTVQLVVYIFQNGATTMALVILFISFSATFAFQAGLIGVLVKEFRVTIGVSALYLALSVLYHSMSLSRRWKRQLEYVWTVDLLVLYVVQRNVAILYYYFYKRTALMLGDPKFHQDSPWLRAQVAGTQNS